MKSFGRAMLFVALISACGTEEPELEETSVIAELSASARRDRATVIRDVSSSRGLEIGALLAGIADAETGLAHCWSEATWACQGPFSSSCGGPVIAGAGDGPCSIRQGGLGMFQFDGGTHDQTLARDGHGILTLEGNIDHAVDFVIAMVIRSRYVPEAHDVPSALAWLASVPIAPGDGRYEAWISTVTNYYNGCSPSSSCWASRRARYEQMTRGIYHEMGGENFWAANIPPAPPPPPAEPSRSCGGLESHEMLLRGRHMASCNGLYVLIHQEDGNVVLYNTWSGAPVYATGTHGQETSTLVMQNDGNLVLYAADGRPLFATETFGSFGATLEVQDDGNTVIYAPGARPIWATNTAGAGGTPPVQPPVECGVLTADKGLARGEATASCNGRFVFVHQEDGNVVLYADGHATWATGTNGWDTSALIMQGDGNLVLYAPGGEPLWASGTHGRNGSWFIVQDDGNAVIYTPEGLAIWATGI